MKLKLGDKMKTIDLKKCEYCGTRNSNVEHSNYHHLDLCPDCEFEMGEAEARAEAGHP